MFNRITKLKFNQLLLFLFVVTGLLTSAYAEGIGSVKGVVKDATTKEKLIGSSVFLQGLKLGSVCDINGNYKIEKIPAGNYEVVFRHIGYKEVKRQVIITANQVIELNVELFQTAVQMNEVVTTGLGVATERRKLTSTVETITVDELKRAPVESIDQLLQGRVTGFNSFSSSGMPGTAGRMSTRGLKSVVSKGTPVFYVDNVRVDNQEAFRLAINTGGAETSSLADLLVGEIDRVEVIKGGASSTLFGSEAANGVVQIFTKKGIPGKSRWTFNVTTGADVPYTKFITEDFTKNKVMQSGFYQSYNIGVNGGNQNFTYNLSGKTTENKGILTKNIGQSKFYNLNAGFRVLISDISNFEVSSSYTKYQLSRTDNNNLPTAPYGGFEDFSRSDSNGFSEIMRDSILNLMLLNDVKDNVNRFRTSVNFEYNPFPQFLNKFTVGLDYRKNEERQFVPKKGGDFFGTENGFLNRSDREYVTLTLSYAGSYRLPVFGFIGQTLAFGAQGFRVEDREETASGTNFSIPGTDDFDNASVITAQESNRQLFNGGFYLTDQIGLFEKIFIDLGVRIDGNSTFGESIGLQVFPKAGIAYNISEEDFYPSFLEYYISSLKLRSSWGQTGNFPPPFTRDRTYQANSFLERTGLAFGNPGNNEIKPEKTTSIDVGFDMGLIADRIGVEFNYYNQKTNDALFLVPRDPASGFGNQQTNVGEILNTGIELAVTAQILQEELISISSRFSFTTLKNEVISLGGAAPFSGAGFTFLPSRIEEGHPIGTFRVNIPLKDANGNYTGKYETKLYGTPFPKQSGSFALNMTIFNNIQFSALAEYAFGHQVVNLKKTLRYFNGAPDAATVVPEGYNFQTASSVWLEDADWIKIREISLSYKFPQSFMDGLALSLSARNLITFGTKTNMLDPELNSFQDNGRASSGGYGYLDVSAPVQYRLSLTYSL